MTLQTFYSGIERTYTGRELRPHFLLTELGLRGSAIAAFGGSCQVSSENMVDWEDRLAQDRIEARMMLHFIGEFFGISLREGVLLQRHLMGILGESLNERLFREERGFVQRRGDDLFLDNRKMSVSIVTASPVSILLHTGVNIDPTGAPVPAIGLVELGIVAEEWASEVLKCFASEWDEMNWACAKVRPVL